MARTAAHIFASAVIAFALGGAISLAAFLVARYGPVGDGWSFRGNGALEVYLAVPAVIAAGFTAEVLHATEHPHWVRLGVAAGLVAFLLAVLDAALLPLFGRSGDEIAGPVLLVALAACVVALPIVAAKRPRRGRTMVGVGTHVAASTAWVFATVLGLGIVGIVLPAGS